MVRDGLKVNERGRQTEGLPRSYSGSDFKIWAYQAKQGRIINFGSLQTISTSTAASIAPVEAIGHTDPIDFTSGSKTVAGSMVFVVLDREPLHDLMQSMEGKYNPTSDALQSPSNMPLFNIVIQGGNEYLPKAGETKSNIFKLIIGVRLFMHGETISIDDFYTEQTYQYQARHVTQWIEDELSPATLINYADALYRSPVNSLPDSQKKWAVGMIKDLDKLGQIDAVIKQKKEILALNGETLFDPRSI